MISTPDQVFFMWSDQKEWDGWGMWHGLGQGDIHTGFWWGNLRKRDYLKDLDVDGRIILKWIFKMPDGGGHKLDCCGLG